MNTFDKPVSRKSPWLKGPAKRIQMSLLFLFLLMGFSAFSVSKFQLFDGFKQKVSGYNMPAKLAKNDGVFLKPTKYPYILKKHLSDFELFENQSVEVLNFYPESIHSCENIASETFKQFSLGDDDSCYELTTEWETGIPVEIRLFDRLERPISLYKGDAGKERIHASGSVYKLQLLYDGTIPKDASISLNSRRLEKYQVDTAGVKGRFEEIPRIEIVFPLNTEKEMQRLRDDSRKRLVAKGSSGNPIETVNVRMYAQLYHSGTSKSDIQIWQSGQGDLMHFQERNPSFTSEIVTGPLFHGIRSFKLYSIKTKEGLLDYAAGHLAENEGIFVPRWVLVDLTINKSHAGLYVMEELPSPELFAGKSRYDGAVQSMGKNFYKPTLKAGLPDSGNIDVMLKRIDSIKFGKTIALLSMFNGTHGLEGQDLRFYLHPILGLYEPVIRDINIDMWPEDGLGIRSLLTHSNWWMGERPFAVGSHYNIKTPDFKCSNPGVRGCEAYTFTTTTLGFSNPNPLLLHFMNIPRYREIFERYLFYFSSEGFKKGFLDKLANTFDVAEEFLLDDESYLETIRHQAKKQYTNDTITIARHARPLLEKARILVVPYRDDSDSTLYAIFNLSTFSVRMRADDIVSGKFEIIDKDIDVNDNGYFLAPSKFFAMSINGLSNEDDSSSLGKLTQKSIKKILNLEFRSYLTEYQSEAVYTGPKPFIRIKVEKNREKEFEESVLKKEIFKAADTVFLKQRQIRFLRDFESETPGKIILNVNMNAGKALSPKRLGEDLIIQNIGQYPIMDGYMLRYLFLNQSLESVKVDFRNAGYFKDRKIKNIMSSLITDTVIQEVGEQFQLAPMRRGQFKKTTDLWIDNFIPLFNGSNNDQGSNIALVDLYFTCKGEERQEVPYFSFFNMLNFHPDYLYDSVSLQESPGKSPQNIFSNSFEKWNMTTQGGLLPEKSIYVQDGSGGSIEKYALDDGVKDGSTSILLKPSSVGNSYLRYQIPDIERARGKDITFSVWVRSPNKTVSAVTIDIQDGTGDPDVRSYENTGDWELLEIEKYIDENAKYLLLTCNIKHDATSPAYFDMITVLESGDKFRVKVHEPYKIVFFPHDLLGGSMDNYFEKITDSRKKETEYVYLEKEKYDDILIIQEHQVLVLKPGQVIRFSENAGILVYGQIHAKGSGSRKVQLLPLNDKWRGVMIVNNNEMYKTNYLRHIKIEGAEGGSVGRCNFFGGLSFINTNIVLEDVDVKGFYSDDSIHFYKSNFEIVRLHLEGGIGDGIDSDWSYGKITESYFNNCGGDCIDFSGSLVDVSGNKISGAYDKGISTGEGSVLSAYDNEIKENTIGIAAKDQSIVKGNGNRFIENKTAAIVSYIKKPDFIRPELLLSNSEFHQNNDDLIKESFKRITRKYDK